MRIKTLRHRILAPLCVFALALFAAAPSGLAADANPPDRITFQGYLTDASGAALGAANPKNYDVVFRLYDALSGGNRKWTEQQTVTVDKGYFSAMLGEGTVVGGEVHPALSSLFAGPTASDRYVEITVKGVSGSADTTIAPRLRLLSAPYACLATAARSLAGTSNIVLVATNNVVLVPANAAMGIGTLNPIAPLDVSGTIVGDRLNIGRDLTAWPSWTAYVGRTGGVESVIRDMTSGNYLTFLIGSNASCPIAIQGYKQGAGGGSRNMSLNPMGGNVGVGAGTPRAVLEVRTAVNTWSAIIGNDSVAGSDNLVMGTGSGGYAVLGANNSTITAWKPMWLNCYDMSGNSFGNVFMNGRLGIGTASPRANLDVMGTVVNGWISEVVGNAALPNNDVVVLGTGSGGAGIGSHTYNFGSWRPLLLNCSSLTGYQGGDVYMNSSSRLGIGLAPSHTIHLAGGAYCDGTAGWIPGSDRAYKRDIQDMKQYGLAQVMALRPVTYIHKQDKANRTQIGFIAQEVKPIVPEVAEGEEGSMGLAYDRLVPVLVNAIKEQQAQMQQQQAQIQQLTADIETLKAAK